MKANLGKQVREVGQVAVFCCVAIILSGCAINPFNFWNKPEQPPKESAAADDWVYRVGPGDSITIFVWRHEDLSTTATVRPDGRFSTALIKEHIATGKTPPELAIEIEELLSEFVRDPLVTVFVGGFVGEYYDQVRVIGEAMSPTALPYRRGMTALDLMITTGGLTEFAAGNRTVLVRYSEGGEREYNLRLDDLIKDGDITANVDIEPGDILIIPEAWF